MPGDAVRTCTARGVVNECDPPPVGCLGDDLMPQHSAGVRRVELLNVGPAKSTCDHPHEVAGAIGLGYLRERRLAGSVDNNCSHRSIVGRSRQEARMAVKLHRCSVMWLKINGHPCWRVQNALDEQGIEYEVVKEAWPIRSKRTEVIAATGQSAVPAIELEDGTWWREESADMAAAIRAGRMGKAV